VDLGERAQHVLPGPRLIAIHLLDDLRARRPARRLAWAGLGAVAISFVNPFGWRALWQPFDFFLHHRNEAIFRSIGEMGPIDWSAQWRGLAVLFAAWPALVLIRIMRGRRDFVEALLCLMFSSVALGAQRFVGLYALVATPYVSRDLEEWGAALRPMRAAQRAALAAAACVAIGLSVWLRPELPNGVGFLWNQYPVAACDFMEAHGVRGRGFNEFGFAGYPLYRFWPDRTRLPFMDIHQSGTPRARELCAAAQEHDEAWRELDRTYAFDYALLARTDYEHNRPLDVLDADSTWALVFLDDVMALYVRRAGPLAEVARTFGYRLLPAGAAKLVPLGEACTRDSSLRAQTVAELQREVAGSPYHAHAMIVLANIALFEGRSDTARDLLQGSIAVDPNRAGVHQSLATIALQQGRPRDALREVGLERRLVGGDPALDVLAGQAWWALGHAERARDAFRRAVRRDPHNQEARAALEAVERSRGR
jgi:tetratricopeptide (TPR) repeat protein